MSQADMRVVRPLVSLKRQVIDMLRAAITSGRFAPGDRLTERDLCEMLDVSRTLVREALGHLEVEGLVQVIPHRGPIVAVYSPEEARSIYELRAQLEEMVGKLFATRASDAERRALKQAFAEMKRSYANKAAENRLAVKEQFYAILAEGAHNSMLSEMLRVMHGRITMLRATTLAQPGRLAESLNELGDIVDAITRKDADGAGTACRRHVENAAAIAMSILAAKDVTREVPQRSAKSG